MESEKNNKAIKNLDKLTLNQRKVVKLMLYDGTERGLALKPVRTTVRTQQSYRIEAVSDIKAAVKQMVKVARGSLKLIG